MITGYPSPRETAVVNMHKTSIVSAATALLVRGGVGFAQRRQATADDLRAAVDWAEKENTRDGSPPVTSFYFPAGQATRRSQLG
jgi:hypothetical protein